MVQRKYKNVKQNTKNKKNANTDTKLHDKTDIGLGVGLKYRLKCKLYSYVHIQYLNTPVHYIENSVSCQFLIELTYMLPRCILFHTMLSQVSTYTHSVSFIVSDQ